MGMEHLACMGMGTWLAWEWALVLHGNGHLACMGMEHLACIGMRHMACVGMGHLACMGMGHILLGKHDETALYVVLVCVPLLPAQHAHQHIKEHLTA